VGEQEKRDTSEEGGERQRRERFGRFAVARLTDVRKHLLDAECEQRDPPDHR
jgi:hypothetical protein